VICIDGVSVRRKADGPGAGTPELRQRHDPITTARKNDFFDSIDPNRTMRGRSVSFCDRI
jgi:hypothetical protein